MEVEEDPSVFVPSAEALAALSEEEAAIAGEGMVRFGNSSRSNQKVFL